VSGLTTWGLILVTVGLVLLPTFGIGHVPNTVSVGGHIYSINYLTYWTAFWALLIGLGAALLGGVIGGTVPRQVDGPYLDLRREVVREPARAPVAQAPVAQSSPPVEQPGASVARSNVVPDSVVAGNVARGDGTDVTTPVTYSNIPE
jgi:hypothetical protein